MRFLSRSEVRPWFEGKRVALVGSGPGVLGNAPGHVDGYEVVVRVNNYALSAEAGRRTDVFYSFFGNSVKKAVAELQRDGVRLCMCKCPDAHAIESEWHRAHNKMFGIDFRWIYERRAGWWFCDTYVPETEDFLRQFDLLEKHIPTTGFAAILDLLSFEPAELYLTGFDFFRSGVHNVSQPWRQKNDDDPIGHVPEREFAWLVDNIGRHPITVDAALAWQLPPASEECTPPPIEQSDSPLVPPPSRRRARLAAA